MVKTADDRGTSFGDAGVGVRLSANMADMKHHRQRWGSNNGRNVLYALSISATEYCNCPVKANLVSLSFIQAEVSVKLSDVGS